MKQAKTFDEQVEIIKNKGFIIEDKEDCKNLYPDHSKWSSHILAQLNALIEEYAHDISLEQIGFPENWKELLNN